MKQSVLSAKNVKKVLLDTRARAITCGTLVAS
jgi:hypothetical protein